MLSLVTGASSKVSTKGLTDICFEPPASFKLKRLCARLDDYVYRDLAQLRGGSATCVSQSDRRSLRSGVVQVSAWPGADRRDFGDNIATLADDFRNADHKILREKFRKKKNRKMGKTGGTRGDSGGTQNNNTDSQNGADDSSDNHSSEFNPKKIEKWVKEKNSIVQHYARLRAMNISPDQFADF